MRAEYGPQTGGMLHELYMGHQRIKDPVERNIRGWEALLEFFPDEDDFIQHFFWLRPKRSGRMERLVYRKAQRDLVKIIRQRARDGAPLYFVILKARQLGFSTLIQGLFTMRFLRSAHAAAVVTSYNDASTRKVFSMTDRFVKSLPFCPPFATERTNELVTHKDSTYSCITAGAQGGGKSLTINDLHVSEYSIYQNAESFYDDVMQTVPDDPTSRVFFEWTANGIGHPSYEQWQNAVKGQRGQAGDDAVGSDFVPFFASWLEDPGYTMDVGPTEEARIMRTLGKEERALIDRFGATVGQLAWRRSTLRNKCRGNKDKFRESYPAFPEEAFLASGNPTFDQDRLLELTTLATEPIFRGRLVVMEGAR